MVREDGRVDAGDPELAAYLRRLLEEPVLVHRRGTVRGDGGSRPDLELRPGDRRYVVARVRSLAVTDPELEIAGLVWR